MTSVSSWFHIRSDMSAGGADVAGKSTAATTVMQTTRMPTAATMAMTWWSEDMMVRTWWSEVVTVGDGGGSANVGTAAASVQPRVEETNDAARAVVANVVGEDVGATRMSRAASDHIAFIVLAGAMMNRSKANVEAVVVGGAKGQSTTVAVPPRARADVIMAAATRTSPVAETPAVIKWVRVQTQMGGNKKKKGHHEVGVVGLK